MLDFEPEAGHPEGRPGKKLYGLTIWGLHSCRFVTCRARQRRKTPLGDDQELTVVWPSAAVKR
jgi:hypothetical protein